MALEDNEVILETLDDDIHDNFNELLEKFQKLIPKYVLLQKKNLVSEKKLEKVLNENKILWSKDSGFHILKIENVKLKQQIKNLTKGLATFVKVEENLKIILGKQKISLNRFVVGYHDS